MLRGLQFIYSFPATRDAVFEALQCNIGVDIDFLKRSPRYEFVGAIGVGHLRLGLNCDYDRLHDLANEHKTIRAVLGHGDWRDEHLYGL
ncbi:MAG: IS5 family transposase [Lentisphaeria bacterium]|jgi:IS5 family transposase